MLFLYVQLLYKYIMPRTLCCHINNWFKLFLPRQVLGNLRVTQVMEASFTSETSLNEWRNDLCDINFWYVTYQI
jgi:hypothetical protein